MSSKEPSVAAAGWISFAGFVMILSGGFSILQGFGMLINSDQFPNSDSVFSQNATTWGCVELIVGVVVLLAGFAVFKGNVLARTVGVIGATISALASFAAIGLYPVWGICIIVIGLEHYSFCGGGASIWKGGEV